MVGVRIEDFFKAHLQPDDVLEFTMDFTYSEIQEFSKGDWITYDQPHPIDASKFLFSTSLGVYTFRYQDIVPFLRCKRLEQLVLWWV